MRRWAPIVLVIVLIGGGIAFATRGMGFGTRTAPTSTEAAVMLGARAWAMPASARDRANPIAPTPETLHEGMAHWADHCATCHDNDGTGRTEMGRGLYPRPPDMRGSRTQNLSDGELFYIIERGVPFTGMPGWSTGTEEGERESWNLVQFIRHLPQLTDTELEEMERLNPKSPADVEEDRRIDEFLKGKD